uniref:GRAM domain containing 1C n=1 Tax=Oncorhynchus mykiss TaxID=8022 RepID=A0A8C7TN27_ONCMY
MDQVSRSGVGSDVTDETASMGEYRWSSEEHEMSDPQGQCLAAPQALPAPTYKQRVEEFKKLFRELPESERLIMDYTCALQRDILLQGRLYLSENWLCFYSNVFRGTKIALTLRDIKAMYRGKTARLIPNAIQICTDSEKLFFTSFSAREKSYQGVFRMWQNTLMDKPLSSLALWQMVKQHYGNDLGLRIIERESLQTSAESTTQKHTSMTVRPGGEDSGRPSTLRLQPGDQGSCEPTAPQGEDLPSPLGQSSINSGNTDDACSTSSRCTPDPSLDLSAPERVSKRSELSLDLNSNMDRFSEQSAEESAEEEERGSVSQQHGRLYVNTVFNISAEKMFELLFTESHFIRRFMNARKITNAILTRWQSDASGSMKRSLNYTITITNPLVGKFSTATENQILYKEFREGQYYLVDSEVYTHDVPYHDYFYTQNRYCIIRHSKRKCRLRVYTDVKYKKQPWGLVKSFITKNSWSGLEDYFRHLESELMEEEAELNQGCGDPGKMIGGLHHWRRRTFSRTLQDHLKPSKQYEPDLDPHREGKTDPIDMKGPPRWNISTIIAGMSIILLILTVLNLGLFFKLWAMEDVANRMYLSTKHHLRERTESSFAADFFPEPAPTYRTREETLLLKTVLQDSIKLLEQVSQTTSYVCVTGSRIPPAGVCVCTDNFFPLLFSP